MSNPTISFRVSADEYRMIEIQAAKAGRTPGSYVRELALSHEVREDGLRQNISRIMCTYSNVRSNAATPDERSNATQRMESEIWQAIK